MDSPSWQNYAAERPHLSREACAAYVEDLIRTECKDGSDEERGAISALLVQDALSDSPVHDELSLLQTARILARTEAGAKPWASKEALNWLSALAKSEKLGPEVNKAYFAYAAWCNILQFFPEHLDQLMEEHRTAILERMQDTMFMPGVSDNVRQVGPFTVMCLVLLYTSASEIFPAYDAADLQKLMNNVVERLEQYLPPKTTRMSAWSPPVYYTSLLGIAFNLVRTDILKPGRLHLVSIYAFLMAEIGSPCPVSPTLGYASSILAVSPPATLAESDSPPPMFEMAEKIAMLAARMMQRYLDDDGNAMEDKLKADNIKVSFDELELSLIAQMMQLMEVYESFREILEPYFITKAETDAAGAPGTKLIVPQVAGLMRSATMPVLGLATSFCMYKLSGSDAQLFVQRFGPEACAGVLAQVLDEQSTVQKKNTEEDEERKPIARVHVVDDQDVPKEKRDEYVSPDELLANLEALRKMGIDVRNPMEQAHNEGILDSIEKDLREKELEEERQEMEDAEAAVAAWHESKSRESKPRDERTPEERRAEKAARKAAHAEKKAAASANKSKAGKTGAEKSARS